MCLQLPSVGVPEAFVITNLAFQSRVAGNNTDDLVLTVESPNNEVGTVRMQMKRSIAPTATNRVFEEAVGLAWLDFKRPEFRANLDLTVIVYQPASAKAMQPAVEVARWAKDTVRAADWQTKVNAEGFSNASNRVAFEAIHDAAVLYNQAAVTIEELHRFVVRLEFVYHDLDSNSSAEVAIQKQLLCQAFVPNGQTAQVWALLVQACADLNGSGGDVDLATVGRHIGPELEAQFRLARLWRNQVQTQGVSFSRLSLVVHESAAPFSGLLGGSIGAMGLQTNPQDMGPAPAARASSPNKLVSRQLESIDGMRREARFADAMAQLKVLGQDMGDFDAHQRALWYLLRGMCRWHLEPTHSAAADDFITSASLCDDEDRFAAARIRGLILKGQVAEAISAGEQALQRFPGSLPVWAAYTNARILQGDAIGRADLPAEHAHSAVAWHVIAAAQERAGDLAAAYESAKASTTKEDASFFNREAMLRYALQLAPLDGLRMGMRMLTAAQRARLEETIELFADRQGSLWAVQSPEAQVAAVTHLGYAMLLLKRPADALALMRDERTRNLHPAESLYRVEIEALCDLDRAEEMLATFGSDLQNLPNDALVAYAQAAAGKGAGASLDAAAAEAQRRTGQPDADRLQQALRFMRWDQMLAQGRASDVLVELRAMGSPENIASILDLVTAARAHRSAASDKQIVEQIVDRVAELSRTAGPEEAQVGAKLLLSAGRFAAAAGIYERILPQGTFSELHVDQLHCYLRTGQRAKARALLDTMSPDWQHLDESRHMAIELAQTAGDWQLVAKLAELEVRQHPTEASAWLLRILAAAHMDPTNLAAIIAQAPEDLIGSVQHLTRLAGAELREGQSAKGLHRLYRATRSDIGNAETAALFILTLLTVESRLALMDDVPEVVGPGVAVLVADDADKRQWVTIDPLYASGLPPTVEFVPPRDNFAMRLLGRRVGESIEVERSFDEPKVYRIIELQTAERRLLTIAHGMVSTSLIPPQSMTAFELPAGEDGVPDLSKVQQKVQEGEQQAIETLEFYRHKPATLGFVARRLGVDIVDLLRGWPSKGPKLRAGNGNVQEMLDAQECLQAESEWVVDLTMLSELASLGHLDILQSLPRVLVASATRDAVAAKLERMAVYRQSGTLFPHEGQLGYRETTREEWEKERQCVETIARVIRDHCDVAPAYGPNEVEPALLRLGHKVLSPEEYSVLLLCMERGAGLLSLDERLRKVAALFDVKSTWLQPLFVYMLRRNRMRPEDYSLAVLKMLLRRRTFVSLNERDLIVMMDQGSAWANAGVNALREYLCDEATNFSTAWPVVVNFVTKLYLRGNCEFGVVAELIEYLMEALLRHPACPEHFSAAMGYTLWTIWGSALDEGTSAYVAVALQRAEHRARAQPMSPVSLKVQVLFATVASELAYGGMLGSDAPAIGSAQREMAPEPNQVPMPGPSATTAAEGRPDEPLDV